MQTRVLKDGAAKGLPAEEEARLESLFRDYLGRDAPGASILIIRDGAVVWSAACGWADVENRVPASLQTNYRLASLTKQFTAMAVMILRERGQLAYTNRLTDIFPDFPAYGREITLEHLLRHTSGLLDYEDLIPADATRQLEDRDVYDLLKRQNKTFFPPGTQYRYSNSGYALLSLIVEKASGRSFAEFLRAHIFDPLGMKNTVAHQEGLTTVANRAYGYSWRTNCFERTDQSLTSAVLGDGGIYSSLSDLYLWDQALNGEKLVKRETLEEAFRPGILPSGQETGYGYGWQLSRYKGFRVISHSGSTLGFRNFIARFPEQGLSVIVLTNRSSPISPEVLARIVEIFLKGARPNAEGQRGVQSSLGAPSIDFRIAAQIVGAEGLDSYTRTDLG